tara:strand:- start:236 stop:406 length:171 start_codon:yes stop_codon:yes gene_type:complete
MDSIHLQINLTEGNIEDLATGEDYNGEQLVFLNGKKITVTYAIHNTEEDVHHPYDL